MTTPLYSLGAKLFVLCRSTSSARTPIVSIFESYWSILNHSIFAKGNCCCTASHLTLGVTNEERDAILLCIKQFLAPLPGTQRRYKYASPDNSQFLAPLSDSCIQNRGVACYLLSLLFSLVSLPFSFCFCVFYQKHQKICYLSCYCYYGFH